ncbi:hypothetical protein ACH5RR_019423 [Cinchona calisaya]|uniref:Sel1-like protein n=1 Tax=Cinchona calisaya TaxID=153742 RepID=A0ABD2ZPI9_9GENT
MGKSLLPSPARLQEFSRALITSNRLHHHRRPTTARQIPKSSGPATSSPQPAINLSGSYRIDNKEMEKNTSNSNSNSHSSSSTSAVEQGRRIPLAEVVADCMKRWFQDALKEAKAGDTAMQVLVGQMYYNGYGISKNAQKGRAWMNRASRTRSSVWKVSDKHPGYNASDSDSEDAKDEGK